MDYQSIFERVEAKYVITRKQYELLMNELTDRLTPDRFPHSDISSIYFDTDDFRLIRTSLDKGCYREKLRLRSYCLKDDSSEVFIEMKKKYHGVTYKRRQAVTYRQAMNYILFGKMPFDSQILKEVDYLMNKYPDLKPKVLIRYQRDSFSGIDDPSLRITFDYQIEYSTDNLTLFNRNPEKKLTDNDTIIMEVKSLNAMPLWMTSVLDKMNIFSGNFSKYTRIYTNDIMKGVKLCLNNYSHPYTAERSRLKYLSFAQLHQSY